MTLSRRMAATAAGVVLVGLGAGSAAAHDSGEVAPSIAPRGAHAQLLGLSSFPAFGSAGALSKNTTYLGGDNGFTGGHIAIEGKRLYLGSYGRGMRVYDIRDQAAPRFLGEYAPGLRADAPPDAIDVGDRHIAVLNGTRRTHTNDALPGATRTDRTEWLDMTDPAHPRVLATVGPNQRDGESHNGDIVDSRRLYFPSGGTGDQGLRIYDINPVLDEANPQAPVNIFRGNPGTLWKNSPYRQGRPEGAPFTHTHDITVYPNMDVAGLGKRDIALLAEGGNYANNSGDTGSVFVIDVTDPRNPVVLLRWLHERGPGHHPIRYHHEAQFLDSDRRLMLVADEDMHNGCGNAGGVVAVRLSADLQHVVREESEWFMPLGTPAPVCSVHVFESKGDNVFFGSYNGGLQVVSYKNPRSPQQVGYFIAEGTTAWGAEVHKDVVYVGDMSRGLDVFRFNGAKQGGKPNRRRGR
jgi:hypothetical protein